MNLVGDIGNTEIKIYFVDFNNNIIKKINFSNQDLSLKNLKKKFDKLQRYFPQLKKIMFCSVVPKSFHLIKKFLKTKSKIKCYEVKQLDLSSFIKIKVNYKQVGSDRLTNTISVANNNRNFLVLK